MLKKYVSAESLEIISKSRSYFSSIANRIKYVDNLFIPSKQEIERINENLKEFYKCHSLGISPTLSVTENLEEILDKVEKRIVLDIKDFIELSKLFHNLKNLKQTYSVLKDNLEFPHIIDNTLDIISYDSELQTYGKTFKDEESLYDECDKELYDVRRNINGVLNDLKKINDRLRKEYGDLILDEHPYRDGFDLLPVNASDQSKVKGIVFSRSASGKTSYILPFEVIELNNKLEDLKTEEKKIIYRILKNLTDKLFEKHFELTRQYKLYNDFFDVYYAKATFGMVNGFSLAIIDKNDDDLKLNSLFHPFIEKDKRVANSLFLNKFNKRVMLLSGPNAGGKTVLLKSIDICLTLARLGFPINCQDDSIIPLIDSSYLIFGDGESVKTNESKFSSHLGLLKEIIKDANSDALILIDEICSGTSPKEGESLAMAIIDKLLEKKCFVFVSTHFDSLKKYGLNNRNICNANMGFNFDSLTPNYKLIFNSTGLSYSFECAKHVGISEEIINKAKEYLKNNQTQLEELEEKLNRQIDTNKKKEEQLNKDIEIYNKLKERETKLIEENQRLQDEINTKANNKIEKLIQDKMAELESIFKNSDSLDFKTYSKLRGQLENLLPNKSKETNIITSKNKVVSQKEIKEGDVVTFKGIDGCIVEKINGNKVKISVRGVSYQTTLEEIYLSNPLYKDIPSDLGKINVSTKNIGENFTLSLNIIGCTVDEAKDKVKQYLSDCLAKKVKSCKIVHGSGTFALRSAVREILNKEKFVESYRSGVEGEGGMGATVVFFK